MTENERAMEVYRPAQLAVADMRSQVALIQQVMKEVMKEGEHFGRIPGCGDKPALLQPGAQKLALCFRIDCEPETTIHDLGNSHREYRTRTVCWHIESGKRLGAASGSCSTLESKYRYRGGSRKCPKCGKETIKKSKFPPRGAKPGTLAGWYCFAKIGGCGTEFAAADPTIIDQQEGKVENPDIADQYNTALKMSEKRSMVAAILRVTAASDIFTQDIEDYTDAVPPENIVAAPRRSARSVTSAPASADEYPPAEMIDHGEPPIDAAPSATRQTITEPQRRRLFAITKQNGWDMEDAKAYLHFEYNIESSKDITTDVYEEICEYFSKPRPAPAGAA